MARGLCNGKTRHGNCGCIKDIEAEGLLGDRAKLASDN